MKKAFKLDKTNIQDILELSSLQEGILYHYLKEVNTNLYFVQLSLEIQGAVKLEYFREAWNKVIADNEMLRTVFRWEKLNKPVQVILKENKADIRYYDLSKEEDTLESEYQKIKLKDFEESVDLMEVPFKLTLCKINIDKYNLLISNHHIIYDGWSNGIILKEFLNYYNELVAGSSLKVNKKTSFKNYIKFNGNLSIEGESFWKDYLNGYEVSKVFRPKRNSLLSDKSNESFKHVIAEEKVLLLKSYCETHRLTTADILYTAWGILLSKYSGIEDILFGTTVSGRNIKLDGIEKMVGLFINTIPLRISLPSVKPLLEILKENANHLRDRVNFENVPLHDILNDSVYKGDELFESIFVIENYPLNKNSLQQGDGLVIKSFDIKESTNYKLTVSAFLSNEIEINYNYSNSEFDRVEIENINKHLITILDSIIDDEESNIQELQLLSEADKYQILYDFNNTEIDYPKEKTIYELFEDQAEKNPDHIALVYDDKNLTFDQLNKYSNYYALHLLDQGAKGGDIIGIIQERSLDMIIGILAILKSGCAYCPINPETPQKRIQFILKECNIEILIAEPDLDKNDSEFSNLNCINLNSDSIQINEIGIDQVLQSRRSKDITSAYIIFTSGSTGNPKGVIINHSNIFPLLYWGFNTLRLDKHDKVIQNLAFYFDWSVWEIFISLTSGSSLEMVSKETILEEEKYNLLINKKSITVIHITPTQFQSLTTNNKKLTSIRHLCIGAEKLTLNLVKRSYEVVSNACIIYNMYGPTEATIMSAVLTVKKRDENTYESLSSIPIGPPIAKGGLVVLNQYMQIQPINIAGELYISGEGLSIGYINDPEKTNKSFIKNIYKTEGIKGEYLYKTGDLARWLPDGTVEFLGRIDHQVKIRGFRIELGEIENTLLKHDQIKESVVIDIEENGEKYLCAYLVIKEGYREEEIRSYLSASLPDYMIPAYFVELKKIPLNSNSKVNRKALPSPEIKARAGYIAPQTLIESKLVTIWSEVLNIASKEISTHVSFFELGGHSLKATVLVSHIHKELDVRLELREIFECQTIESQAKLIDSTESSSYFSIPKAKIQDYYPLSSSQRRLYLLQQMDLGSTAYNMHGLLTVPGGKNKHQIEDVFNKLILRHENFRTSFEVEDDLPIQRIHSEVAFFIKNYKITKSELPKIKEDLTQAFDLSQAPLLRVAYLEISDGEDLLLVDMHHIISDGRSHAILEEDFYQLIEGKELEPLRLHYKDYSEWQNSKEQQKRIKGQETYWLDKFAGELPALELPTDYSRPVMQGFEGASVGFVLSEEETKIIHDLCKNQGLTLYMSLLSVFTILLSKLSGQEDIIVGSPIAARRHADLEDVVGMFVNTLAIRNEVTGDKRLIDYLQELKEITLEVYDNQEYQFEDLVDKLSVGRDTSRNPLFDVMFNLLNQAENSGDISGFNNHEPVHKTGMSKFDLTLTGIDYGEQLLFNFTYCTQLFKSETIDRFISYFKKIIADIGKSGNNVRIKELEIIPETVKQEKLNYFNENLKCELKYSSIQAKLKESYLKYKDNVAIETGAEHLTYSVLNHRKQHISNWIIDKNIEKESVVGIFIDDKTQVIISILGILDCSCVFVPIDTNLPVNRFKTMIDTTGLKYFITGTEEVSKLSQIISSLKKDNLLILDDFIHNANTRKIEDKRISLCSDKIYIYFTSGSSGTPKPIIGRNESLLQIIEWEIEQIKVDKSFRVSQLANIGFDAFLRDIFVPLFSGGTVCIPFDNKIIIDEPGLTAWINRRVLTLVHCVPSVFKIFSNEYVLNSNYKGLKYVLMAGEQISLPNLANWYSIFGNRIQLVNLYGATEVTLFKTFYFIKPEDIERNSLPIGQAIPGSRMLILDKHKKVCDVGIKGELYLRTAYSTYGYYNDNQLTNEKFVRNPFIDDDILLYRTGDLAVENTSGEIEIIGRIDHQVKIRGFRIELGEIENVLLKYENIKGGVVLAIENNNEKYLCAYIVSKEELNHEELKAYMSAQLPEYMIPYYFVQLDKLPLTSNGKVNRKVLPIPEIKAGDDYVAPSTEIEKKLVEIWSKVLNLNKEDISVNANFFSIGGHSLKATVLTSNIHKETGVEFPLREVFLHPTIKSQASQIATSTKKDFVSIPKAKEQATYPLSPAQKRLYLLQQFDLSSTAYNMPHVIPLGKEVKKEKIEEVVKQLVKRHDNFRTSIILDEGEPVQLISKKVDFNLEEQSIESTELENTRNKFIQPFDLSKAPFLRAAIVNIKGENSLLMMDMHHIISDGTSHAILEKEFQSLLSGEELTSLPLQYKDYSQWQNSKEQQELIKDQEQYWLTKFEGEIPVLNLPIDYVRPLVQSHEGATVNFVLGKEETEGIKSFTKENDLTLYMTLLSVFSILLSKLSGQEDIVVGMPIAGRNHADLENIVGMFVNTLAIRNEVNGNNTLKEFISNLKQTVLGAYENQNYQFEDLVDKVLVERDTGRNPIFDVVINLLNQAEYSGDIPGIDNENLNHTKGVSKFDLTITAIDYEEQLLISFNYCTELFKAETIDRFIVYFKKIVSQIVQKPERKLAEIEIISAGEKQQILYAFNDTQVSYPSHKSIARVFNEQVKGFSKKIALEDKEKSYTYQELDEESNKIANYLIKRGVTGDQLVGLMAGRSSDMIIGILGILKTGGAYVPIDPAYPKERVTQLIEDSSINILLSTEAIDFECNLPGGIININDPEIKESSTDLNLPSISSSNIAYVMYTSGSTGTPKGVVIEQKSVLRLVQNNQFFPFHSEQKILLTGAPVFDATTFEIWGALLNGGSLYIASNEVIINPELLGGCIRKNSITSLWLTSSLFNQLLDQNESIFDTLKYLLVGGDVLSVKHINKVRAGNSELVIINGYGPTENTTFSTTLKIEKQYESNIPIGKPISNSTAYIFDKSNRLQAVGVPGELLVGGDGLAREYLNNPELTREKFIENPYKSGERLYTTGDLARWLPDGNIEFLGRIDHQVKIRGFRVELGEIENALLKHKNIKEGVVLAREETGDKYLCAYIVNAGEFNEEEIRTYLLASLPDYMIPSYFIGLDKLPLTSNGKVNRKVLPAPEIKAGDNYAAPTTEIEEKLVEIWSEVLNINKEEISVKANFFSMGGHSLRATVLTSNIHKVIGVEFPLREVFVHPTIKSQASQIEKSTKKEFVSIPKAKEQSNYPVSPAQKRLYLIQQFDLTSTAYNMPGIISLGKDVDKTKIEEVFKQLINRHESFRTSIIVVDQEPVQIITKNVAFELEELSIEKPELENTRNKFIKPFDLSKAPLLRAVILDIKGEDSLLMIDMHHIISDGTSHAILEKEFKAQLSGEELPPLPLQYKDYSQWQNSKEQQEFIKDQEQYWLTKFEGEIPVLNLPTDYARPIVQSHEGARVSFVLGKEETEGIRFFAEENELTLYISLLSVFSILLSKLSGQEDIVVGAPIAGRNHADLENIVGMFINTLAIRNEVKGEETIREFVSNLKQTVLGAYQNQNYQFEDLVDKVSAERDTSRNPIFDVVVNLLNQEEYNGDISGFKNKEQVHETGISKFDLTLTAVDYGEQLMFSLEYCTQLFKAETIDRFIAYFKKIVNQLAGNAEMQISNIEILCKKERQRLLYEFNNTETDYPKDKTIHQLFEEQAGRTPDSIALVYENQLITYKELNEKSNQFARYLIDLNGNGPGVIGILYEASIELYVGIFGIIKARKTYLPIDNTLPDSRIQFMLKDSCIETIFTGNTTKEYLSHKNTCINNVYTNEIDLLDSGNLDVKVQASDAAYIIYTSGSTGLPKGTLVEHKALVNLCFGHNEFYKINSRDRISKFAGFGFDASVWETFPGLIKGASLHVIDDYIKTDTQKLNEYFHKKDITVSFLPTQFCENFMEYENNSLRILLTGGDKLKSFKQRKYRLYNNYGPTENTVVTSRYEVTKTGTNIPIGKPIENCYVFILNSFNKLQPVGVAGELCVSGYGLAQGYLNQVELTQDKFISHPFKEGERLYRTGDLARWLANGNIEFLGRIDHQVKIRGFRIELGEIETTLLKHENIKESAVLAREENGDKYLCAYIVCKEEPNQEELGTYMSAQLPDYMLPSYFVELEELPLTANGKVNRKVLPSPEVKAGDDYLAPTNEIEERLVKIWSEVLNVSPENISTKANFFAIGGHSLKATILTGKIYKEIGVEFPLREVFTHPTVKTQASQIATSTKKEFVSIPKAQEQSNYPLSPAQKRIYLLQQFDLTSTAYNMPGIISLGNEADKSKIKEVFKKLINRHDSFRTSFELEGENPVQVIKKEVKFKLEKYSIDKSEKDELRNRFIKPFDLSQAPLLRVAIADIKGEESQLMIDIHHIISDGVSQTILEKEFHALYSGEELPSLSLQFKDYAVWQDQLLKNPEYDKKVRNFWRENIGDGYPEIKLPYDFNIKTGNNYSSEYRFYINDSTLLPLRDLANKQGTSLFTVVYSVFNILLSYLTGEEDVYSSVINSGRTINQVQELVGCFANSVLIKNNLNSKKNVLGLIADNHAGFMDVHGFQDFYYEEILEEKGIKYPEVPVAFNMLNFKENTGSFSDKDSHNHRANVGRAKFDLELYVNEYKNGLIINWIYNNSLFKPETIEYMASRYNGLLESIAKEADKLENLKIHDVKKEIPQQETGKISLSNSYLEFEKETDTNIITRFESQVAKYGEKTAIVYSNKTYSYLDLDRESNQIANTIISGKGINNEGVALLFEQGTGMIKSMLGVLKSGNYYIPLDVTYPINRLKFILKDSRARTILTNEKNKQLAKELQEELGREIRVINITSGCKDLPISSPKIKKLPGTLAYVLYTSGSTGVPKGVIQNHRNVLHFIRTYTNNLHINNDDKLSLFSSYGFDSAVQDIYGALLNGASVHVYDIKQEGESSRIQNWMVDQGISIYHVTPTVYRYLVSNLEQDDSLDKVRIVVLGGEAVYKKDFNEYKKHFNKECIFINGLGSTESTLTLQNILNKTSEISRESVPVGFGVTDTDVYLEKQDKSLALPYEEGEIIIKSKHLALGYLNAPEKTHESFAKEENGERILRTGDIGRYLADNSIEYIGRKDFQIKIRGNRVELGEVEGLLDRFPGISKSVVKYFKQAEGDGELVSYYILKDGVSIEKEELKKYIELQVPSYMVPMHFIQLEEFPYTLTGKIDRKALLSPEAKVGGDYEAPANETEEKLLEIWSEVLNTEKEYISVKSNFLDIGGNSFRALVLMSKIHKATNVEFPLNDIFIHRTIRAQASQIGIRTKTGFVSIPKAKEQSNYPVSPAQKRLYMLQQFDLTSTVYNMPNVIPLGKELDKEKIEEGFKQLIKRHESFRTSFTVDEGEPVQIINKEVEFELEELSIEITELENTRSKFIKPFDLSRAPLLRVAIVDIKGENSLLIDMHHIISDGTSHTILKKEFQALLSGEELSPLPLQYKDYSQWQNSKEQQERVKDQEQYWLNKFEGEIPVLNLPTDYVRPSFQSHEGATVDFVLGKEETEEIRIFTKENDLTLSMTLLSVFSILLSKLSGQDDIIVGTPIAGRNHADLENIVGMFVNTLSIRNEVRGEETIQEFVSGLKQTVLGAYENQNYQFEDLVNKVSVERDTSRNPIFDVMFNLMNQAEYSEGISRFNNREQVHKIGISKFDLTIIAVDYGEQISLSFEYCTQLFKSETIDRFILYFKQVIVQLTQKSRIKISEIDILSEEEKRKLLYDFNNTKVDYPKEKTIHRLFEDQVEQSPGKYALNYKNKTITYQELNEASNQVAHYLKEKGLKREDIVGIELESSYQYVVCTFAVLKAGGAYLPIDKNLPGLRKEYIIENSELKILIHNDISYKKDAFNNIESINIRELDVQNYSKTNPSLGIKSSNLAYIIYTSGSAGKPKGTLLEHKGIVSENIFWKESLRINSSDRCLQFSNISFDASVWEIYQCLFNGAGLYIPDENIKKDTGLFEEYIVKNQITVVTLPPPFADTLNESTFKNFRLVITAGSETNSKLVEKINKNAQYINAYGPTETSVCATYWDTSEYNKIGKVVIGSPIQNIEAYILDSHLQLQGIGIAGELCFSGEGLARAYLKNPELTADKFIPNPFKQGERLYRTGDLARWLPGGNIEFLGRIDHQVKIRGFRIELGEIENVLLKHEIIKECIVTAIEENNEKYLCAYIVCKEKHNQEELRTYMSAQLPDYMIPSYFVQLESLPLTTNGKVNRKVLPAPQIKAGDDYVAPTNKTEEKLVKIWSEVLKIPQEEISTTANFFAIGGHSLKATILVSEIHKELGVKLQLKEIFQQQTIKKMAVCISGVSKISYSSIKLAEKKEYHALSSAQKRLYFIQQMDFQSLSYNMPMVIPLEDDIKLDNLENAFTGLVSRHESFRTSFITVNNEPVQRVYDHVDFKLDKKETTSENLEKEIKEYIKPFDLSKDILIRACLMHVSNGQNVLVVDMHHIISDGTTSNIVREDFLKLFNGEKIAPLKLQYKDFSNWQNTLIEKGGLKSRESYWKDLFSGDIPVLNLQTDYKRPESFTSRGDVCRFSLGEDETALLRDLGKEMGSTLYMNILAVLNTLFYRFSNQEDIIIGSGIAGRQHTDLQGIAGMFVNTLAMRNYPNGEKTYLDFLEEVSDNSIAAFENQDIQFEDLVDMLNIDRDISRNPLFDINMLVQNFGEILSDQNWDDEIIEEDSTLRSGFTQSTSKFDMTFFVWETVSKIDITIEYYTDIFKRETIERYIKCFRNIVSSIIKNPKVKLKEIELLSREEKQQLLYEFNDTQSDYPKDKTIHQLFEEQVDKAPDNIALVSGQEQITYRELDNKSNQVAHYLRYECETRINECIGIYLDRGINVIISMLGILKSGCGYLPLAVSYPEERIKFMINDTSTRIILSEKQYVKEMNKYQWECSSFKAYLCLDSYKVQEEKETQNSLNNRKLWEYVGDESVDAVTGGGWSSSYTGEPMSREEMDEYGDNVLKKLEPHLGSQTRILEIGCASGISMFSLAPKVALYYGTDLSGTILQKNEERIKSEGHSNIIQKRLSADEIDRVEEKDFDIVIINSVIQCFDGHNYLKKVIRKAIDLMKPEGLMFLGDIMDQDLKNALIKDLGEFKRTNTNKEYSTKTDLSEELFLSRRFWDDLKCEEKSIERIETSRKIFTLENELTKYRYDVLVSINKNQEEITYDKNRNKFQHDLNILSKCSTKRLTGIYSPNNLAYIIYTSGSTGKPKGTLLEHKGIVSENLFWKKDLKIHPDDRCLQFSNISFDASVWEIYSCLFNGASLYMPDENIRRDTGLFEAFLAENLITVATLPPPFADNLDESTFKNFRLVVTAGSETNCKLIEKINKNARYINAYGPTETSVCATYWDTSEYSKVGKVVIGSSIQNIEAYIIDSQLQLQGIGIADELCFSGEGLARGYLNNPELTQEKFISHPFKEGERLYRTGDLARWLPGGKIEFLGRIDHQVKIRGFRIELGEIESTLLKHENIKECVVTAIKENNEKSLCAYVVCKEELSHKELRAYMSSLLPGYMVPSYFVQLDELPLTSNGKVNRKALPSPQIKAGDDYAAPANETEEKLVEIWSEVLKIEKEEISVEANFFTLGGHSLKATILISKINSKFNVTIPLAEIFKSPAIRQLSQSIINTGKDSHDMQDENLVLLKKGKNKENNLFLIHAGSGEVDGYIKFCSMLNDGFNYWGIKTSRIKNYSPINITIEDIASKYIEKIKIIQPEGPYNIAGWCIGGTIAFEMIKQLEQKGEEVKFFALINATAPSIHNSQVVKDFSANTELELISESRLVNDKSIIEKINNLKRPDQIWSAVIDYIESNIINTDIIRKLIPGGMEEVIPDFGNLNIQELVYYFNTIRSLGRARDIFVPETKNKTHVNFFSAGKAEIQNRTDWNKYCHQPIKIHKLIGDHFSIFKEPEVVEFAKIFDEAIRDSKMK